MGKDKEKEVVPKFNFEGSIAQSKYRVAGVPIYTGSKAEPSLEELLEKTEKNEVLSARKDAIVTKLRKQGEPNPKRYIVDPETGRIDIDEENGEYTQKDAMMVSASIKGRGGQYDAAIALINAAKTLATLPQPNIVEKPKEFYVDETGVIIKDPEAGEYTLSEARVISESLRKEKQTAQAQTKSFLDKLEDITEGLVSKRIASMLGGDSTQPQPQRTNPVDEIVSTVNQVEKIKQLFAPIGGGAQSLAQSGVRGEILKLMLEDERERLKMQYDHEAKVEQNKHLGTLASTVKENLGDGVRALMDAAAEAKAGTGAATKETPQAYECGTCHAKFTAPQGVERVGCPECGTVYTKEQLGIS